MDSDGSSVIVDNSANDHIFSEEDMFPDKIEHKISNGLATIGGKDILSKVIGTGRFFWTYDEGKLHRNKFNNVLYFTVSPVNILSENK